MKIGSHLVWQLPGESVGVVLGQALQLTEELVSVTRFVHVVNFYLRDGHLTSDQSETIAALARSVRCSVVEVRIVIVTALDETDEIQNAVHPFLPDAVVVGTAFRNERPTVSEILLGARDHIDDIDHVVLSNADICPMPTFYDSCNELINGGAEALVINRRSVFGLWPGGPGTALAPAELGVAHPGFDCFVLPAKTAHSLTDLDTQVGAPYVMLPVLLSLVAKTSPLVVLTDAHLTYHFGDERSWSNSGRSHEGAANLERAIKVKERLLDDHQERLQRFFLAFSNWDPTDIAARTAD